MEILNTTYKWINFGEKRAKHDKLKKSKVKSVKVEQKLRNYIRMAHEL